MKLVELDEGSQHHPNRWPYRLAVCGQYEARQWFSSMQATHVISIRRASRPYYPPKVAPERHLVLEFEDTTDAAHPAAPAQAHLDAAMAFVDALPADARLLVHCLHSSTV